MKHVIMGTAGHVDHGKTALVRALSGIECDTHPEEKRRGITINLGFAHLDLPNGDRVSIIDVPGHRDFVHTMVSGACAMDFAVLVIAADSGIMPQTREHLQIMQVLGVKTGIIALTRIDLVDADIADIAREESAELVKGTFLEACPVIRVSSVTGEGIEELRTVIASVETAVAQRRAGEVFRMFVDRIFTVAGFGTVVTGSVLSGMLKTESKAYLLPGDRELRVRRLERHGQVVDTVHAGDRASINLVGLSREDFQRGMVVSDRELRETGMVDAQVRLFPHAPRLGIWNQAVFLLGTYEAQARIHLVDRNFATGGDTFIAQVHLPRPLVAQNGDRFVIRSTSNDVTLGGGEIIDAVPLHHRRRPPGLISELQTIAEGRLPQLIAAEVRKRDTAVWHTTVADTLNIAAAQVLEAVQQGLPADITMREAGERRYLSSLRTLDRYREKITVELAAWHRRNPLLEEGRTVDEFAGILGLSMESAGFIRVFLQELVDDGTLKKTKAAFALAAHTVVVAPQMRRQIDTVEKTFLAGPMHALSVSELLSAPGCAGMDEKTLRQIMRFLTGSKKVYAAEEAWAPAGTVDACRAKLLAALAGRPQGMTVAEFRDLVAGNRKICLLMLAVYDAEGVTQRQGDVRVITEKGRALLAGKITSEKIW